MSNIEEILNSRELSDRDKLYSVRKELGINPLPEDVPVGEAWHIEWGGNGYFAVKKHRGRWMFAYPHSVGAAADHHEASDGTVTLVKRLVPDPGDFVQAVKDEAERMGSMWKTKYEKQRLHTASVEASLARRNESLENVGRENERLRGLLNERQGMA